MTDAVLASLPKEVIKSLALARSIARNTPVTLFAEPTNGLSEGRRAAFKDWLGQMSGHRTIVIATADRSLLEYADRFVFLDGGRVSVNDVGETGKKKLKAALSKRG